MARTLLAFVALWCCTICSVSAQSNAASSPSLRILSAQAGLFGAPGTETTQFIQSATVPLKDGQAFGWRMSIQTSKKRVLVREELSLPEEPKTWGDPEPDIRRKTTPDGRTAITEVWLEPKEGFIFHTWTVTKGDPKGVWILKVSVEAQPEKVFRLQAH